MTESRPVPAGVGGWRTLSAEQLRALARRMIEVEPLLRRADQAQILDRLGWRRCDQQGPSDYVVDADSGLGLQDRSAELWLDDDDPSQIVTVVAFLCDSQRGEWSAFDAFRRDVFAVASRALTEEFGPPTETEPGEAPEVRWRLGTPILRLSDALATVVLKLERASDYDENVALSRDESA
ncbi:hypothetical protein GCM10023322_28310 [Rugosimonospora acidiphila]|uniref:Uncharacterized protein n=1 Tax=Rugosimonospora acidiphila TaxID=556531 RepID=A0ABP9RRZ3_9ACTN